MRARKVYFKAEGLRPNTLCFPFLDGVNIGAFTKGVSGPSGFQRYSDTDSDFGNTLDGITVHPDGSNALVTDGNGIVSGSFIVPNNDATQISTGTKEFKVMDISVDDEKNAAAIASAPYAGLGHLVTKEAEYTSSRQLNVQGKHIRTYGGYASGDGGGDDDDKKGGGGGEWNPNNPNNDGWSDTLPDTYSEGFESYSYDPGIDDENDDFGNYDGVQSTFT